MSHKKMRAGFFGTHFFIGLNLLQSLYMIFTGFLPDDRDLLLQNLLDAKGQSEEDLQSYRESIKSL